MEGQASLFINKKFLISVFGIYWVKIRLFQFIKRRTYARAWRTEKRREKMIYKEMAKDVQALRVEFVGVIPTGYVRLHSIGIGHPHSNLVSFHRI